MKKLIFLIAFLISTSIFAAEPVGLVVDAIGDVTVMQEGQPGVVPTLKQEIYLGDVIQTQKTGGLKILFKDDTVLTIKENSKAVISEFLFNPKKKERKAVFDVAYGKIRSVVGRFFGENQPVEIKTPTAVGGIRGTDVAAQVTKKETKFYCFDGLFYAANIDRPGEEIQVEKGTFTDIVGGNNPTPIAPIPQDILQNNGTTFDISMTSGGSQKGSVVAAGGGERSQFLQLTKADVAVQSTREAPIPPTVAAAQTGAGASIGKASVFDVATSSSTTVASVVNASPTAASDLGVQILPGGVAQSAAATTAAATTTTTTTTTTSPITITILLP